jgi:hypothetical protein
MRLSPVTGENRGCADKQGGQDDTPCFRNNCRNIHCDWLARWIQQSVPRSWLVFAPDLPTAKLRMYQNPDAAESVGGAVCHFDNQGCGYARNVALEVRNAAYSLGLKVKTGRHPSSPDTPAAQSLKNLKLRQRLVRTLSLTAWGSFLWQQLAFSTFILFHRAAWRPRRR